MTRRESAGRYPYLPLGAPPRSSSPRQGLTYSSFNEDELVFSLASLWEIAIKTKIGKLNAIGSPVAYIRDEMKDYGMELLPIRYEHILQLEALPLHHSDPFDRLLVAQAVAESLPVLTGDQKFQSYPVKLIW